MGNSPSVSGPNPNRSGTISHYTVAEYNIPDIAPALRTDFQRRIPGMKNASPDNNVLAVSISFAHFLGSLDYNAVISGFNDAILNYHIPAAVRINAIIIRSSVII